jgi:hypothetical protein
VSAVQVDRMRFTDLIGDGVTVVAARTGSRLRGPRARSEPGDARLLLVRAIVWTPDTTDEWQAAETAGADLVITDRPIAWATWHAGQ